MAVTNNQNGNGIRRPKKLPHTMVQMFLSWGLPISCNRFLCRHPGEFPATAFLLGAGTGGLLAIGLFQLLVNPMNIYEEQKMVVLYSLVGLGAIGWGTSPHIRCASILLIPKMLGREGRLFVMGYALAAIYAGPAANLRHNLNEVIASLGCTVELQINNTREAWRVSTAPLRAVFKDLLSSKESLKRQTQNISASFEDLDAQVKMMEVWCRNRIPVEGNFGQTYDTLNQSIHGLNGEFSANIDIKEEKQTGLVGLNISWEHVSTEVRDYVERQEAHLEWALALIQVLLSCTFLIVLHGSFSYIDSYNQDIRFDNIYISTYFYQIDERRKKLGKRTLLPLRKAEKLTVIFPCKPTIQASEMKNLVRELLETLPILLLLLLLCALDRALYTVFDTIRQHSYLQYSFYSNHKLEVKVEGNSMLAQLLRKTIGALNTSSDVRVETNNMPCLPQPVCMDTKAYWRAIQPTGLLACLCLAQAYGYRLRRVIAAFYFPKREKKRVLFFYNELLKKRAAFTQLRRAAILRRAHQQKAPRHHLVDALHRRCPLLRRWLCRRCVVCQEPETSESYVCPSPDCETVYCLSCWDDMRQRCPVCTPREELSSSAFNDSNDDANYAE
ncbi:E3 ubiquitin-protein ligase DCST1-like isoform X4 [Dipodomys merriami]|uniref:E3 ubiquitin-protein ligase DCST1-like isoform X4 n=1 Tax=Dipodomys merriami TaxID=94247 RepID=UPI0038557EB4